MTAVKRVAIIGAGPAGAITVDAVAQEKAFDIIRVFERQEEAGGCWVQDPPGHEQQLPDLTKISQRTADIRLEPPVSLPATTPKSTQYRFSDTSIYPHLETNIDAGAMSFSQEPIPPIRSLWSVEQHGFDTPFRPWRAIQQYIISLLERHNYQSLVSYNTTVELVKKDAKTGFWTLTLRKPIDGTQKDYWWTEEFDAVIVASGHYTVPFIPHHAGLNEFVTAYPGAVIHSKAYRNPESYRGKKVIVVGASISGSDIASGIAPFVAPPLHSIVRGKYHPYFFDYALQHPKIIRHPSIVRFDSENGKRSVLLEDGTTLDHVDHIIFGTGYSWTLPFLPNVEVRNNRVTELYQHIFWQQDPTLCFVGAVAAGFTFKVFEWQAVAAARFLAGRIALPAVVEQIKWEEERISKKGGGVLFTTLYPDFEEYFEEIRALAGEPIIAKDDGEIGRRLPPFQKVWRDDFDSAHLRRIEMWKRNNALAEKELKDIENWLRKS